MCQSGGRSPYAASDLHEAGYQKIYFQVEGFEGLKVKQGPNKGKRVLNGGKNAGLPWSYKLKTEKMYFNFAPKGDTFSACFLISSTIISNVIEAKYEALK